MKAALEAIEKIFGKNMWAGGDEAVRPHLVEWRGRWQGEALCMVAPKNAEEIARLVRVVHQFGLHIVPQGGNTGLAGGQIPFDKNRAVLVNMQRMNQISPPDSKNRSLVAGAGAILANVQASAEKAGMQFPLSLASEGSASIGGLVASNAGGTHVMRYGMMRDLVLGLEVVAANGEIWNGLSALRKDNSGYALKQIFAGSEGSLGIITAAALRLFPLPAQKLTFMAALPSPAHALALLEQAQAGFGDALILFEFLSRGGLDLVLRNIPQTRDPFSAPHPFYVLAELASPNAATPLPQMAETLLAQAQEKEIISDARIAASLAQAKTLWRLRETMSEAQKKEGASIKNDIAVPVASVPQFLEAASEKVLARVPQARLVPFGHLGDGSIHFNISAPKNMAAEEFLALYPELTALVEETAIQFGGTISAEHGIGIARRDALARHKDKTALALMRQIKQALDPENIFNPGKVLPELSEKP